MSKRLSFVASAFIFAADSANEDIRCEVQRAAAAKAGKSAYRRAVCLGQERLSNSGIKGKARSFGGYYYRVRNEAFRLLETEANRRGFAFVDTYDKAGWHVWMMVAK